MEKLSNWIAAQPPSEHLSDSEINNYRLFLVSVKERKWDPMLNVN